jgi:hypothetical protein
MVQYENCGAADTLYFTGVQTMVSYLDDGMRQCEQLCAGGRFRLWHPCKRTDNDLPFLLGLVHGT